MSGPLKVDTHLHLYPSRAEGGWWKTGYEIWEYGERAGVRFSEDTGTLEETAAALHRGGFAHGVVLNLFVACPFRQQYESTLPPDVDAADRARALAEFDATIGERYVAFNRWLMDTARRRCPPSPGSSRWVPWALPAERNVAHLREMAERGARGVKLHPVLQKFEPNETRLHPVYRACNELGLAVLSHTGPARDGCCLAVAAAVRRASDSPGSPGAGHRSAGSWPDTLAMAGVPAVAFDWAEIMNGGCPWRTDPGGAGHADP